MPKWALKEIRSLSYKTAVPFAKMRDVVLGLGLYAAKEQMAALLKEMDAVPNLLKSAIELAKLDPNAEPEQNEAKRLEIETLPNTDDGPELATVQYQPEFTPSQDQTGPTPSPAIHEDRGMPSDPLVGDASDPSGHDHAGERPEEPGADYTLDGYVSAVSRGDVLK